MKKILNKTIMFFLAIIIVGSVKPQKVFAQDKIRIGFLDTGISTNMFDENMIVEGYNYIEKNKETKDLIGHGTSVASVWLSSKYYLHSAEIVPLVVQSLDSNNEIVSLNADGLALAIKEAVDVYKCDILNISMGVTQTSDALTNAVLYAEENNVLILSAVGNDGDSTLYYPSAYQTVIGIGSVDISEKPSSYSQENASVGLVEQGEGLELVGISGKDILTQGTSYSTAVATSKIVLYLKENSNFNTQVLRTALYRSAKDINGFGYDQKTGYGMIDVNSANEYLISYAEQLTNEIEEKEILAEEKSETNKPIKENIKEEETEKIETKNDIIILVPIIIILAALSVLIKKLVKNKL